MHAHTLRWKRLRMNVFVQASYVAGLLSHTPKELDVTSHLRGALRAA